MFEINTVLKQDIIVCFQVKIQTNVLLMAAPPDHGGFQDSQVFYFPETFSKILRNLIKGHKIYIIKNWLNSVMSDRHLSDQVSLLMFESAGVLVIKFTSKL